MERDEDAEKCREPLAAPEPQPHRKAVARIGAERRRECAGQAEPPPNKDSHRPLERIEKQSSCSDVLAPGAQHVGCADVTGADVADIAEAGDAGQDQSKGDRAEQVADQQRAGDAPAHLPILSRLSRKPSAMPAVSHDTLKKVARGGMPCLRYALPADANAARCA